MTAEAPAVVGVSPLTVLTETARAAGLAVIASSAWPESEADEAAPSLAGFIVSSFSPIAAEVAQRCLLRRAGARDAGAHEPITAVIMVSALGDIASAVHVAAAVDAGDRIGPLMFFQSVPNAVAGYVATKWRLAGPVVCVGDVAGAVEAAGLLVEDGDADEVLLVHVGQGYSQDTSDRAGAVIVRAGSQYSEGGRP